VKAGAKLAQVVPYAMEESLAGEVEQFHFAIGATDDSGATQVAAVRREELRSWLDAIAAAGIEPLAVVPDTLCVPDNPGKIVAVIDAGQLLVRAPGSLPVALDAEPLTESFALAGREGVVRHVQLYGSQQDWRHAREMIEALREVTGSLDLQILPDGALPLIAAGAVRPGALSLLQGEFARRTGWRAEWQRWRVAAFLAVAALALYVGGRGFDHAGRRELPGRARAGRAAADGRRRRRSGRPARAAGGGRRRARGRPGTPARVARLARSHAGAAGCRGRHRRDRIARFAQGINARGLDADVASTSNSEDGVQAQLRIAAGGPR
jgi:hypothetical protein